MTFYLLLAILALLLIILVLLIFKSGKARSDILFHQKIDSLNESFTRNILQAQSTSSKTITDEFSRLYEKIGGLGSESREILNLARSFHDVLKPTKTRGVIGESILENLLKDVLPQETVLVQYGFKDGKRVDFAIKLPTGLVPLDAKFSLESFKNYLEASGPQKESQRRLCIESVKKRILETAGYIYPDEGTTDFALMYIPSEAVYYFIVTETSLSEFAVQKKVFITGPNTLYAYLKTIFLGFQAMKIEKKAGEIYRSLQRLDKDIAGFIRDYTVLGSHLRSASLKYEELARRVEKISLRLQTIGNADEDGQSQSSAAGQTGKSNTL